MSTAGLPEMWRAYDMNGAHRTMVVGHYLGRSRGQIYQYALDLIRADEIRRQASKDLNDMVEDMMRGKTWFRRDREYCMDCDRVRSIHRNLVRSNPGLLQYYDFSAPIDDSDYYEVDRKACKTKLSYNSYSMPGEDGEEKTEEIKNRVERPLLFRADDGPCAERMKIFLAMHMVKNNKQ